MAALEAKTYISPTFLMVGKFQKYESMFFTKGAWRIGTTPDGSCFFHSLLTATDRDYRSLSKLQEQEQADTERLRSVKNLRKALSTKLTPTLWESLQEGSPRHFSFVLSVRAVESLILHCLKDQSKLESQKWVTDCFKGDIEALRLVHRVLKDELFNLDAYSKDCALEGTDRYKTVRECDAIFNNTQITRYVKELSDGIKEYVKHGGVEQVEVSAKGFANLVSNAARRSRIMSFKRAQKHFEDVSQWIGTEFIPFLSNQFNTNIFIISGQTGLPYLQGTKADDYCESRGSIFLLAVDDQHYECLGFEVKEEGDRKSKVRCKVAWNHPYVQNTIALLSRDTAEKLNPLVSRELYKKTNNEDIVPRDDELALPENVDDLTNVVGPEVELNQPLRGSSTDLLMALQED